MLAGLRHRAVDRADHEDRAVHLRRAGDHVLDVVGVARAVDVRVVALRGRVLDVAGRDGHDLRLVAAALRLGRFRDLVVGNVFRPALVGGDLGQRRGQRGLAVIDMSDGADVYVRFASVEFFFGHVTDPRAFSIAPLYPLAPCRSGRAGDPISGADVQDRTGDLVLTKDALCQLSYIGLRASRYGRQVGPASLASRIRLHHWLASRSSRKKIMASAVWSGRRGSNPRPTAWKAVTLPLSYSRQFPCARLTRIWSSGHLVIWSLIAELMLQGFNHSINDPMTR